MSYRRRRDLPELPADGADDWQMELGWSVPDDQLLLHCREATLSLCWAANPLLPLPVTSRDLAISRRCPRSPARDYAMVPRREVSKPRRAGAEKTEAGRQKVG